MILDQLSHAGRYRNVHPGFAATFDFLERADLAGLADGRYPIEGDRVYALVQRGEGRNRAGARLEAHRRYIDIQYTVSGIERIGWRSTAACMPDRAGWNDAKDIGFFQDSPDLWLPVRPGAFAVFFPADAHAPMAGTGEVHKVVVKIAV